MLPEAAERPQKKLSMHVFARNDVVKIISTVFMHDFA